MKFLEKFRIVAKVEEFPDSLKKELSEYDFDGYVEFSNCPTFVMDMDHYIVLKLASEDSLLDPNGNENQYFIEKKGELIQAGQKSQFLSVDSIKLKRNFGLQDYLDQNKNAACIVFYVSPEYPYSIFHPGNIIRPKAIK